MTRYPSAVLLLSLFALVACSEPPADDVVYRDIGTPLGCLDADDAGVSWELDPSRLLCVDVGLAGGGAVYALEVEQDGSSIAWVIDGHSTPPEGGFDFPQRWIQIYQAVEAGDTDIIVTARDANDPEADALEVYRLRIHVPE